MKRAVKGASSRIHPHFRKALPHLRNSLENKNEQVTGEFAGVILFTMGKLFDASRPTRLWHHHVAILGLFLVSKITAHFFGNTTTVALRTVVFVEFLQSPFSSPSSLNVVFKDAEDRRHDVRQQFSDTHH